MAEVQTIHSTTQTFLDIYDITHDLVILKDGSASIVITVDAMNFGLLAEEEQDAVMYAYAGLLNSLNYPIQVVVKSQTKDVTNYLRLLKSQEDQVTNELMRKRINRYRDFVANLIQERNVLDKKFYVVIPASALELGFLSAQSVLPGKKDAFDIASIDKNVIVEKAHNLLEPRRDHLISQFARIGLYAAQLNTQEIIQLFYVSYNPEAVEGQEIADSKSYTSPLVTAGIEESIMTNTTPTPAAPAATDTNLQPQATSTIPAPQPAPVTEPTPNQSPQEPNPPQPEASAQPPLPPQPAPAAQTTQHAPAPAAQPQPTANQTTGEPAAAIDADLQAEINAAVGEVKISDVNMGSAAAPTTSEPTAAQPSSTATPLPPKAELGQAPASNEPAPAQIPEL